MLRLPYGKDVVLDFPLIDSGAEPFETTPVTIAAGDLTVMHNRLAAGNPTGKTRTFTSGGTYEIKPGDTVTGATSAATAVVIGVRLTSGTFAAGTAAGVLFLRSDSGTFQSENLDVGSNLNVATIAGALDAAGLFVHITGGMYAVGIPGTQLQGARGWIKIQDLTATEEWADTAIPFETYDHPLAADPQGCLYRGTATAVAAGTLTAENLDDGYVRHLSADASAVTGQIMYIESATTGAGQAVAISSYVQSTRVYTLLHNWPLTPTGTIVYKIYASGARTPAHVITAVANSLDTAWARDMGAAFGSRDAEGLLKDIAAVILGRTTGAGTASEVFKTPDNSATRVTIANDGTNRTGITQA